MATNDFTDVVSALRELQSVSKQTANELNHTYADSRGRLRNERGQFVSRGSINDISYASDFDRSSVGDIASKAVSERTPFKGMRPYRGVVQRDLRGGLLESGRGFRQTQKDIFDVADIVQGVGEGGITGAGTALRGVRGILPRGGAIGLALTFMVQAATELAAGFKDTKDSAEAKYGVFRAVQSAESVTGFRASMAKAEVIQNRFKKEIKENLGFADRALQDSSAANYSVLGFSVRGLTNYFGLSTREGDLDKEAADKIAQAFDKASTLIESGFKSAEMGDVVSAEKDFSKASAAVKTNITMELGSPTAIFLRAERGRQARAEFARSQTMRYLRTGD
jgi:hypothetical protein